MNAFRDSYGERRRPIEMTDGTIVEPDPGEPRSGVVACQVAAAVALVLIGLPIVSFWIAGGFR